MKRLIVDLDNTITVDSEHTYENAVPNQALIQKLREYKQLGFDIVISTSRNIRTYDGNVGKIALNTVPVIVEWLKKHDVPCDELYIAKPWCGFDGFYVDDKAIRPSEFLTLDYQEIKILLGKECEK